MALRIIILCLCFGVLCATDSRTIDEVIKEARVHDDDIQAYGNAVLVEGDILMTREEYNKRKNGTGGYNAIRDTRKRWTGNTVPYYITNEYNPSERAKMRRAMDEYEHYTCVKFTPYDGHRNYIYIHNGGGCSSWVGMLGGRQDVSLARYGCVWHHTIVHELGHAVGFEHEQTRPDRDSYITVHLRNVAPRMRYNFDKYGWNHINSYNVGYDYRSVMHYGTYAFSTNGRPTIITKDPSFQNVIGRAPGLSYSDIKLVNLMYNCASHCNVECPANAIINKNCQCWCPTGNARNPVKLCDGTGSGEGSGEDQCKDHRATCTNEATNGKCSSDPDDMLWQCPKACKVCGDGAKCDKNYRPDAACDDWALRNYCFDADYLEFMSRFCRRSCNYCDGGDILCVDKHSRCQEWASPDRDECHKNPHYMLRNCAKSCGICGGGSSCENFEEDCDRWYREGYCKDPDYKDYMSRFCRKACKICK